MTDSLDEFDAMTPDDPAVLALLAEVPTVTPPPHVRAALLAMIEEAPPPAPTPHANRLAALKLPGFAFDFAADADFQPLPVAPGVLARVLHVNQERQQFTVILKMEPGSRLPAHHHDGPEECVILDGSLITGGVRMRAGDYQRAVADSDHAEQWTDTGALLYLTAPLSLMG